MCVCVLCVCVFVCVGLAQSVACPRGLSHGKS